MDIEDFYRKYQQKELEEQLRQQQTQDQDQPKIQDITTTYQGNGFVVDQLDDWRDKTVYTLVGPVEGGIQHNLIITVDYDNYLDSLANYADRQIMALENELKSCRLLKKGETALKNGMPAYEAIFSWYPTENLRIYQHQIFVLNEKVGYNITASFTKKTRKTLGPKIVRMMLSFNPYKIEDHK